MKKTLAIVALILAGLAVLVLVVLVIRLGMSRAGTPGNANPFGGSGSSSGNAVPGTGSNTGTGTQKSIQTVDGSTVAVHDFTQDSQVLKDPNVQGQYDIAGGQYATPATTYQIFYDASSDYFGVDLLKEPLGATRIAAEQQLMQTLGITQSDMCKLNYAVAVGPGVNDTYAGQNLGFSFCPGATPLPQ